MNRGQVAVPGVILTVLVLLIWYILWIYPQQRYELLFGEQTNTGSTTTPTHVPVYQTIVGEIGQSSGELLDTQVISNLSVSYPVTRTLIAAYSNIILNANVLGSEFKTIDLSSYDSDFYNVEAISSSVVGLPKLRIELNNTLMYDNSLLPDSSTNYNITRSNIEEIGPFLKISCAFSGFQFWSNQQCGLSELNIYRSIFYPRKLNDSDIFYLTPMSKDAELVELSFTPTRATTYPVELFINEHSILNSVLVPNQRVTLSLDGELLGLDIDNTFKVSAMPGAEYSLSNINMKFSSVPSGMAAKYLIFDVPARTLRNENDLILTFNLTNIIEPGDLNINILNTGRNYIVRKEDMIPGLNRLSISTADLDEFGNNLKVYSTNGRLVLSSLIIDEP
ncbi:Uncharacterised protein [Candidatus Tiddalikarchaeum anstoanum]|nr:Uncharacterised protein [Candidatus Tiddalikarchaeum anstoanum]